MYAGSATGSFGDEAALVGARGKAPEPVLALAGEMDRVVHHLVPGEIVVRVRGGGQTAVLVREAHRPLGGQGLGIELDRQRGLRHGDVALADPDQVHVRVVGDLRREHRLHALEDRAARIGAEPLTGKLSAPGRPVGLGVEEAAAVGDLAVGESEAVECREAVEPMAEPPVPHLELRRRHAHQSTREPRGHVTLHRESVDRGLLLLGLEPEPGICRREVRECGSHGRDCTV